MSKLPGDARRVGRAGFAAMDKAGDVSATDAKPKDVWDKLSALSGIIAAVLVPVVLALIGNWYSSALKERETALSEANFKREWVQLGLSILRDANTRDDARQWAVDIINFYSDVKMPRQTIVELVKQGAILPAATPASGSAAPAAPGAGPPVTATDRVAMMDKLQTQGIRALLDRDLPAARAAYDLAYQLWPTFRDVDEIRTLLRKATPPRSAQEWKNLYRQIRGFDLRGVSKEIRDRLQSSA
jgi:hypothetical protein